MIYKDERGLSVNIFILIGKIDAPFLYFFFVTTSLQKDTKNKYFHEIQLAQKSIFIKV